MKSSGFSLLEILLSISLIALLAIVVAPKFDSSLSVSEQTQAKTLKVKLEAAIHSIRSRALIEGGDCSSREGIKLTKSCYPEFKNSHMKLLLQDKSLKFKQENHAIHICAEGSSHSLVMVKKKCQGDSSRCPDMFVFDVKIPKPNQKVRC
jgi:Tfp pilus assembly protein FimT